MTRHVSARLELESEGAARLVLAIAVARGHAVEETLAVTQGGRALAAVERDDAHGTRLHEVAVGEGPVTVEYSATVTGRAAAAPVDPVDAIRYIRPSRYCESDVITAETVERFGELEGADAVEAVAAWVRDHVAYVSGSSQPTDGATATLLSRQGVCRDFAHLVTALLRGLDVPARVVGVYAPELDPMDFHAVVEAAVDGQWVLVDATGLAPRGSMVRISTGRDAADTAFLTTIGAPVTLSSLEVDARSTEPPAGSGPGDLVLLG